MTAVPEVTPGVTHVNEEITPELAEKYLKQNNLNRPLMEWHIRQLARDMDAGRWMENGEGGVTFDTNGEIADGQHTLHAVVRSGVTIRCRVSRGVEPDARITMNSSVKQRFRHTLATYGVANSGEAEALLRKALVWQAAEAANPLGLGGLAKWHNARFSPAELLGEWPEHGEGISKTISESMHWKEPWSLVGNFGALQFLYWLLMIRYENNPATVFSYIDRLAMGSQDEEDRVLVKVRLRLHRKPNTAPYQVWWLMRGWNAFTRGERLAKLQLPAGADITDPFPKLQRTR